MSQKLKVIYTEFVVEESLHVVDLLKEEYHWDPVVLHGGETTSKWQKEKYPNAVFDMSEKLRKGHFDYSFFEKMHPIDSEIISKLSKYELNYLNWLEDPTGYNFTYYQRRSYYYDVLKYWNTVIQERKPDLFVSYGWPHLPSDYPLYLLCKYVYDIPVLFFDVVPRNNGRYFNIACSLEELHAPFMENYRSEESKNISPVVKDYLEKLRSDQPSRPWYIDRYFDIYQKQIRKEIWKKRIKMVASTLLGRSFKKSNTAFKRNTLPLGRSESEMTILDHFLFREKLRSDNLKMKKKYDSICTQADGNENFIFFAGPYQPEAFSNLITSHYEDVFLILDLLADALPEGWCIYYKEHPTTFNEMDKGALGRNIHFYEKLASYDKVKVLDISVPTFDLIDKSKATVTTGGTIGWESIVRNTPAIVFASMWYIGCDSILHVNSREDVGNAVKKVAEGFLPDKEDIDRYAEAINMASIKDLPGTYYYKEILDYTKGIKPQMKVLADAYFESFKKFY